MSFKLGRTSLTRLDGVHPLLVGVVVRAIQITTVDFTVYEGLRTPSRQRDLFESGATETLDSRHIVGMAVDLPAWVGFPKWDAALARQIKGAMFQAAKECGVTLRWGGDWNRDGDESDETFRDMVHFELPEDVYGRGLVLDVAA